MSAGRAMATRVGLDEGCDFQFVIHRDTDSSGVLEKTGFTVSTVGDALEESSTLEVKSIKDEAAIHRKNARISSLGVPDLSSKVLRVGDFITNINGDRTPARMKDALREAEVLHMRVERPPAARPAGEALTCVALDAVHPSASAAGEASTGDALHPSTPAAGEASTLVALDATHPSAPAAGEASTRVALDATRPPAPAAGEASTRVALDAGGDFEVRTMYDGREVVDGLEQAGYLQVSRGQVVSVQAGTLMPGDPGGRFSSYVFGCRKEDAEQGWLPAFCFECGSRF